MALIQCGTAIDGIKELPQYFDTDDLDDLSYYYFRKAESLGMLAISRKLLIGNLTGSDIENDPIKYMKLLE